MVDAFSGGKALLPLAPRLNMRRLESEEPMANRYQFLPAMLLALGVWIATPACAAQMYGYRGDRDAYRELERHAYDNGFREGVEEGQNDARRHRDFSYQRHDEYRDADQGYQRGDGDRDLYRRSYRQGFQAGYREAYNRNAGYREGYGRRRIW